MTYYAEYRNREGNTLGKGRENLRTDSIIKARSTVAKEIDMNPYISGGIFDSKNTKRPVGYVFFPEKGPVFMHRWVVKKDGESAIYLLDYDGTISHGKRAI